jgi:hypothetical protein
MGRLQELLDELRARVAAQVLADDSEAEHGWDSEGGVVERDPAASDSVQRVADDSVSRSAPSTSSGMTDSV